jgi:hypothetical protein
MFLPPEYVWFEPVLIASVVVFVVSWIGNSIFFGNRFANALVTALVFAAVFGAITYFGYGSVSMKVTTEQSQSAPAKVQPLGQ